VKIRVRFYYLLRIFGSLILVGALLVGYAFYIEPGWLKIERVTINLNRLPSNFSGYRIAQLSDFHLNKYNQREKLHAAVDQVIRLSPDVIVLTGDFISSLSGGEAEALELELSRLSAPDGILAVLGNHDWWLNPVIVSNALRGAGVTLLRNSYATITRSDQQLYIAGVDDAWVGKANLARALEGIPSEAVVILLAHEPDFADTYALGGRVILQLSGHSHGGQVRLPGLKAFITPLWGQKYTNGLFTIQNMQLYVTRGVGVYPLPFRFFCRPEVTLLTIIIP